MEKDNNNCFCVEGLNDEIIFDLAEFYKAFCDPSRLKILYSLLAKEMTVSDIVTKIAMSQPAVSHQLRLLRHNGLVKYRKDGKNTYYSLDDDHVELFLRQGLEHIIHKNIYGNHQGEF